MSIQTIILCIWESGSLCSIWEVSWISPNPLFPCRSTSNISCSHGKLGCPCGIRMLLSYCSLLWIPCRSPGWCTSGCPSWWWRAPWWLLLPIFPPAFSAFPPIILNNFPCTFVVIINIFNHYIFLLLFLDGVGSIGHSRRFKEFISLFFLLDISVGSHWAPLYLLELIPIIDNLLAACPPFLGVMENGLTRMITAGGVCIRWLVVLLPAARALTFLEITHRYLNILVGI